MSTFKSFAELGQALKENPEQFLGEEEAQEYRMLKLEEKKTRALEKQRRRECQGAARAARELFYAGKRGEAYKLLDRFAGKYPKTQEASRALGLKKSFKREVREQWEARKRQAAESKLKLKLKLEAEEKLRTFLLRVERAGGRIHSDGSIRVKGRTDVRTRRLLRRAGYAWVPGRRAWVKS